MVDGSGLDGMVLKMEGTVSGWVDGWASAMELIYWRGCVRCMVWDDGLESVCLYVSRAMNGLWIGVGYGRMEWMDGWMGYTFLSGLGFGTRLIP